MTVLSVKQCSLDGTTAWCLHQCGNGHWMGSLASEPIQSNCKELWIARRKKHHLQTAWKDHTLRKRDGVPQKETHVQKGRERGNAVIYDKDDKSLIDVENADTTYFDYCAFFAAVASFLLLFCLIHLSLASLACCATYFTFLPDVFMNYFILLALSISTSLRLLRTD